MRRAPLLLLDEPTAALDAATEARILAQLGGDRTVVLVAHRPALLAIADRVVELPAPAEPDPAAGLDTPGGRVTDPGGTSRTDTVRP